MKNSESQSIFPEMNTKPFIFYLFIIYSSIYWADILYQELLEAEASNRKQNPQDFFFSLCN